MLWDREWDREKSKPTRPFAFVSFFSLFLLQQMFACWEWLEGVCTFSFLLFHSCFILIVEQNKCKVI